MFKKFFIVFLVFSLSLSAQQKSGSENRSASLLHEVSNKEIIQSVYPEALMVEKINDFWFKILDKKNQILGFAMSSTPYCKDVIGYNNTTPVMIITDKRLIIQNISLLSNQETLSYVKLLERKGFFDLWVGKTLKEAKKVELDGYTGATSTAIAISKNVNFLLENGTTVLPKK